MKKTILSVAMVVSLLFSGSTALAAPVQSIKGSSYYDTGIQISQKGWETSDNVVIASIKDFPDALSGTALSIKLNAPILFTAAGNIDDSVLNEVHRLKVKNIYILGGTGVIPDNIEYRLYSEGVEIKRLWGKDRFSTAVNVGKELVGLSNSKTVYLSNAYGFADALSASTFAGQQGSPILLTDKDSLNAQTKQAIKDWGINNINILGGEGVVSKAIENELANMEISVTRYGGVDRYDTSKKIVKGKFDKLDKFTIVTGKDYHNALMAAPYAAKLNQPVLLIDDNSTAESAKDLIDGKELMVVGRDALTSDDKFVYTWEYAKAALLNSSAKDRLFKTNTYLADETPTERLQYVTESGIQNVYNIQSIRSTKLPYMDMMIEFNGIIDSVGSLNDHKLAKEAYRASGDYYNLYTAVFNDNSEIYPLIHNAKERVIRKDKVGVPVPVNYNVPVVLFYDDRRIFVLRYRLTLSGDNSIYNSMYKIFISPKGDNSDIWAEVEAVCNGTAIGVFKTENTGITKEEFKKYMPELANY